MKPGDLITGKSMPKANGRPQLWYCFTRLGLSRLRIIYPSGLVEFQWAEYLEDGRFQRGCTTRDTQEAAMVAAHLYSTFTCDDPSEDCYFGGYL
jgi:hypothetical protein